MGAQLLQPHISAQPTSTVYSIRATQSGPSASIQAMSLTTAVSPPKAPSLLRASVQRGAPQAWSCFPGMQETQQHRQWSSAVPVPHCCAQDGAGRQHSSVLSKPAVTLTASQWHFVAQPEPAPSLHPNVTASQWLSLGQHHPCIPMSLPPNGSAWASTIPASLCCAERQQQDGKTAAEGIATPKSPKSAGPPGRAWREIKQTLRAADIAGAGGQEAS